MNKSISVFFPLRSGSTRVIKKNTRPFHPDGRSLFQLKLDQIASIRDQFHEVVVSTNDIDVIDQFPSYLLESNVRIERRPDSLCQSNTKVQDLIDYVPTVTSGEWVFWLHATSPFVDESDFIAALSVLQKEVINGERDSVMSVNRIQQFIWSEREKDIINCDRSINPWPNTQDLDSLYEMNHAFYINSRLNFLNLRDRIGKRPALYVCEGLRKIDIDWQNDFDIAQALIRQQVSPNA